MSIVAIYLIAMLIASGGVIELGRRASRKLRIMNGGKA